ncbi:hypothetical protein MBLNU457_4777t1 [Dothideomycetes sp. NU457]
MTTLSQDQIQTIKATVPVLQEHGVTVTSRFYSDMLKDYPDLNNLFNQSNQANQHQAKALAGSLYAYATNIDDLSKVSPALEHISHKHASLYVRPDQYDIVGRYLLQAFGEVLGEAFTPAIRAAWAAAYWEVANLLIGIEKDLLAEADGWTDWRDFRIVNKVQESTEVTSFYLSPVDGKSLPSFKPGQYISVQTDVPALKYMQARQYSLSDAPNPRHYRISVKKEPEIKGSDGEEYHPAYISNLLHESRNIGDVLQVSHPYGEFYLDPKEHTDAPIVLVSAGVGLTPMVSIVNTLVQDPQSSNRTISWIHAARSSEAQAFGKHMLETVKHHDNISSVVFNKKPLEQSVKGIDYDFQSRMDLDVVDKKYLHLDKPAVYYICGPSSFMTDMAGKLKGYGVDQDRIKLEIFGTGMLSA